MSGIRIGEDRNEHGTVVSVHLCLDCGGEFTVCPPSDNKWGGCLAETCASYDPKRDVDKLMGGGAVLHKREQWE